MRPGSLGRVFAEQRSVPVKSLKIVLAAGLICGFGSHALGGAVTEAFDFDGAEHHAGGDSTSNTKMTFNVTGGYALGQIEWNGQLDMFSGDYERENFFLLTSPWGQTGAVQVGPRANLGLNTAVTGSSHTFTYMGKDPAGTWTIEFTNENFDDVPGGADSIWDNLTITFTDDTSGDDPGSPDMTFCQLYGLQQYGRVGDEVGLALATTSWNVGTENLLWKVEPDGRHPYIGMNLYRLSNDRFEQIGQSWLKHGYFALSSSQCSTGCNGTDGSELGIGCTDTYTQGLNAQQSRLGPRYEVNPWDGTWDFQKSVFDSGEGGGPSNNAVTRRLRVHDADLDASGQFFAEGYYVCSDDIDVMNSAAWKPVSPSGSPGGTWSFGMSGSGTLPNEGFALDAWAGATQTMIAPELPVVERSSPDGRSIIAAKAIDLGGGTYRYEYAILNIDMDAQIGAFSVPIDSGINVQNAGFHAVEHHDEPMNTVAPDGVAISNSAWSINQTGTEITWSTTDNPLRWGTLYNFWFEADAAPTTGDATVSPFRTSVYSYGDLTGQTVVPTLSGPALCDGDANSDGAVDVNDISYVLFRLGDQGIPSTVDGDIDCSGNVDVNDISYVLFRLNTCDAAPACP